jgi:poly(3-hydroxybutyrate) depolymerase
MTTHSLILALILMAPMQVAPSRTMDESVPPGNNYDKAEFRLWLPEGLAGVRAIVVMTPGSNGDGRPQVEDAGWQAFAVKNKVALVGCRFTDKPHDQGFIEEYVNVSRGSGKALETALSAFAERSKHPELATAPLLLWGMSAGGQFNYEFVAWKPERVAAFVVNKGGIYYSALLSREARNVPGMLFVGGSDMDSRISTITGLFAVNRRGGALWALANEPGAAHVVGRSLELAKMFFEDVLSARVAAALRPMSEKDGFVADLKTKTFQPAGASGPADQSTAWLPTERVARAWQAIETGKDFER